MRLLGAETAALQEVGRFRGDLKNDNLGVALKYNITSFISDFFCGQNSFT